jgi:AcrR family transcriptional regulator
VAEVRGEPVLGLRERKKRQTRTTLINAAVGLCETQGFDSTTVDQIAAVADVSPRTFSRYFTTKDAVALALIDEILDTAARELARQPLELGTFEALRRAYLAMAEGSKYAGVGGLSSERLLQILRIVMSSAALRQSSIEFRGNTVDAVVAARLGVPLDHRRVRLIAAVWGAVLMTAVRDIAADPVRSAHLSVDDVMNAFETTYAEFTRELADVAQPV